LTCDGDPSLVTGHRRCGDPQCFGHLPSASRKPGSPVPGL